MTNVRMRIVRGFSANVYGQVVVLAVQLASVPLFLARWDLTTYGSWLVLSTVPAYVALSDFGIVTTAGSRMTIEIGAGRPEEAQRTFQSSFLFVTVVCALLAVVAAAVLALLPGPVLTVDARVALLCLVLGALAAQFGGVAESVYRSTGRFADGTALTATTRLAEFAGMMVGLLTVGSFAAVAAAGLAARVVLLLVTSFAATRRHAVYRWGYGTATREETRSLLAPAGGLLAVNAASAIGLQGITVLTSALLGPAVLGAFNAYRTIARSAVQFTSLLSHAVWPEFSTLYGRQDAAGLRALYLRTSRLGAGFALACSALLFLIAPPLIAVWTHGRVGWDPALMAVLLVYAAVAGFWHVPRILLLAINRHIVLSLWLLGIAILTLGLAAVGALLLGAPGVAWAMVAGEAAALAVSLVLVARESHRGADVA